jgi:hypothetical protein
MNRRFQGQDDGQELDDVLTAEVDDIADRIEGAQAPPAMT